MEEPAEIDLRSIWGLVRRNRWIILACVALAAALAWWYNSSATPYYQTFTTLRINEDSPTATGSELNLTLFQDNSAIETEMGILASRSMAQSVAAGIGMRLRIHEPREARISDLFVEAELSPDARSTSYTLRREGSEFEVLDRDGSRVATAVPGRPTRVGELAFTLSPAALQHERIRLTTRNRADVVAEIRQGLDVERPNREQSIIMIRFEGPDPRYAALIANSLAEQFLDYRRSVQRTQASSTVDFLNRQIDTLDYQLREAEESLRDFREREQIVNLEEEGAQSIERYTALRLQHDTISSERDALADLIVELDQAAEQQRDPLLPSPARRVMGYPGLADNPGASQMLSTLIALENERAALLDRRRPEDPDVQALTDRIHGVERELRHLTQTYLSSLETQLAAIEEQIAEGDARMSEIPGKEVQYQRLLRQTTLLEQIYGLLQTDLKEAQIAQAVETPYATVIDTAMVPGRPVRPHKVRNLLLAVALGFLVGIAISFGREHLDDTIHTVDEMESVTGVPVLGMIPHLKNHQLTNGRRILPGIGRSRSPVAARRDEPQDYASRLIVSADTQNTVAEAFRSLRTNLTFATPDQVPRTIVVTSSREGDGKTTSVVNLAAAFAHQGLSVLLIDSDMRRGILHKIFKLPKRPGLSNVLVENLAIEESIHTATIDADVRLDVMTSGTYPPNPAELLGSSRLRSVLDSLAKRYDVVLIDSPPLTVVTDAAVIAPHVDGVLVVARASQTEVGALEFAMMQLRNVNATVKGTILNDLSLADRRHGSHGYYAYTYEYSKREED